MRLPAVDIIIVNYNGRGVVEQCIQHALASAYPSVRVVVVDNHSTDGSPGIVRGHFPGIFLLEAERNLGYGGAINLALKHSQAEYVLVLNSDSFLHAGTIASLVKCALSDSRVACVQPKIYRGFTRIIDSAGAFTSFPLGYDFHLGQSEEDRGQWNASKILSYAYGAACLIKRQPAERIGFFDEDFFLFHEESDFCWRARRLGYKIISCPKAIVWHIHSHTMTRESVDVAYLMERSRILMLLKNYELMFLVAWLLVELAHSARLLRKKHLLIAYLRSWIWNVESLPRTFLKRRRFQVRRKESDVRILSIHVGFPSFLGSSTRPITTNYR